MSSALEQPIRMSVAIAVRDAAEPLAETLVSVRNLADEMVVLDTGSSDETVPLANSLGARVFARPWDDSFAAARNAALTYVQGMWVLWLDAGETLGKDEGRLLKEFVEQHADPSTAYCLRVAMPALDDQSAGEQVARLRLHPRRPGLQFTGRIRETLDRSLFAFGIGVDHLPLTIARSRREFDPAVKEARAQRNLALAELQLAERGPTPETYNCLAEACQALSRHEQAAHHYRQALDAAEKGSIAQLEAYYGLLVCLETMTAGLPDAAGHDPRRSAQVSLCTAALETFPLDAQLLCALGGYLQSLGRPELAMRSYEVCYRQGQIEPAVWHLPDIREVAASCQAALLDQSGQAEAGLALLQDAIQSYPDSRRIARQLLEHHVQRGRCDEALIVAAQMPISAAALEPLREAVVGACASVKGNWTAARSSLKSAIEAGCRERFAWRWLATSLLALGASAEAEELLASWEAFDPSSPEPGQYRRSLPAAAAHRQTGEDFGRSVRIDAPQEAAGPTLAPASDAPMPLASAPAEPS
jgi:tetratricopeptide (TPR) repeat protein